MATCSSFVDADVGPAANAPRGGSHNHERPHLRRRRRGCRIPPKAPIPCGLYLRAWRLLSRLTGMAQGATQFCRKSVFDAIGGYNEQAVDRRRRRLLLGRSRSWPRRTGRSAHDSSSAPRVQASSRRFDKWPLWKILVWTNPLIHRPLPPSKGILERLVLTRGAIDRTADALGVDRLPVSRHSGEELAPYSDTRPESRGVGLGGSVSSGRSAHRPA